MTGTATKSAMNSSTNSPARLNAAFESMMWRRVSGGDEFLILLPGISAINSRKQIENIISRIQQTLKDGWVIDGQSFSPTCSIGSALYPEDGIEFEELIQKADHALYEAKKKAEALFVFTVNYEFLPLEDRNSASFCACKRFN